MDVGAVWSAPVVSPVKEQEGEKARRQRQREGPMPSISATLTSLTVVTLSERSSIKPSVRESAGAIERCERDYATA